jgi:signal transduction histidine kinase
VPVSRWTGPPTAPPRAFRWSDGCGGIPPEELPRVFDTGWRGTDARTPPSGAGLGLAIVRGIVEAHHGRAAVRNVPGGRSFEVRLPVAV